jgi:hypothetical protein
MIALLWHELYVCCWLVNIPFLSYAVHVQDELGRIEAGHALDSLDMSRYLVDEPEDERLFENLKVSDRNVNPLLTVVSEDQCHCGSTIRI